MPKSQTPLARQYEHLLNQWKEQAFLNLKHELRTPLTQIQGYLELLEMHLEQLDTETRLSYLHQAQSGCEEMLSLINATLETASQEKTEQVQQQPFPLKHEVQAVIDHFEPRLLEDRELLLYIPETCLVQGDKRFIRQIIRNLLSNACKYTDTHTRIMISVDLSWQEHTAGGERAICVRVRDYGSGIPPMQQSRLFQQFVRLPQALRAEIPGTGLGLFICKQLVEAMGGRIWVESTGRPGEGTCFAFTLSSPVSLSAPLNEFHMQPAEI
jgi:signal transduction histidine kinase